MAFSVYIIQSQSSGRFYVGSTQDVQARLARHNQGRSSYTKAQRPWHLIYTEQFESRSEALNREYEIKKRKSKSFIETLVRPSRR
jgi:putative endonuclease